MKVCDVFIAEVSYPSTGLGIELERAHQANVPIICIYKKGSNVSRSLREVSYRFVEYTDTQDLVEKLNTLKML